MIDDGEMYGRWTQKTTLLKSTKVPGEGYGFDKVLNPLVEELNRSPRMRDPQRMLQSRRSGASLLWKSNSRRVP